MIQTSNAEQEKLSEAEYFLSQMSERSRRGDRDRFRYYLSAFLSAARSVLQYAGREVKGTSNQAWYDRWMTGEPLFRFFKDKRDLSIHEQPVSPRQDTQVNLGETVRWGESINIEVNKPDGTKESSPPGARATPVPGRNAWQPPVLIFRFVFSDWKDGDGEVLAGSAEYLEKPKKFVNDGHETGCLTPRGPTTRGGYS